MVKLFNIALIVSLLILTFETKSDIDKAYSKIKSWYKKQKTESITFFQSHCDQIKIESPVVQIILIRHGHPEINKNGWYGYKGARDYIQAYDTVGVYDINMPPVKIGMEERVEIFSSPLNRALDTAKKLIGNTDDIKTDSVFLEFQREITPLPLFLPINGWTSLSRIFWILGLHSSDIPSFRSEKSRAESGAKKLEMAAINNKKVILVGHGFVNKYIIKYLKKNGWNHSYNGGIDYLSVHVMTKIIEK